VQRTLIIACGALAREIVAIIEANGLAHLELRCLPATLHNRPERIAGAVRDAIRDARSTYARIWVAYADCGTGGALDAVLARPKLWSGCPARIAMPPSRVRRLFRHSPRRHPAPSISPIFSPGSSRPW